MSTLTDLLPAQPDPDSVYAVFESWAGDQGLALYPAQEQALLEIVTGSNLIMATPTGSGKSLVATGAQFVALAAGQRSYYTAPIKALVSEKFFAACRIFGPDKVGMLTGDAAVNPQAPIICCTAEVLANIALREGSQCEVGAVVMDEFHYYGDPQRGWAWQVPIIELPQAQFVLMSATLGDVSFFIDDLSRRTGRATAHVTSTERPVPLFFSYATTPVHETIADLVQTHQAPVYVVHPSQAQALERAQAMTSLGLASRAQRDQIADAIAGFRFSAGFGKTLNRLVRHGIGVHHAGMLPRYRRLVEHLAQAGLLPVICGTDTLGVGINVPIRSVLVTSLAKFDGVRQRQLSAREFHQIAGRAGRAGYDTAGTVVVQAPDHEVENARLLAKAGDDVKKQRRIVRKTPEPGSVSWSHATFERLVSSPPETLRSSFAVSHSMILNLIARPGDPVAAVRELLETNHESRQRQLQHLREAIAVLRSLRDGGIVEKLPQPTALGRTIQLTVDLQPNFALNQPLAPFAVAALEVLDQQDEQYALNVVSVIEAIIENPRQVLTAQRKKVRDETMAAMKADGLGYEQRMELLEEVTYPQPLAELLNATMTMYRQSHPWVADFELAPKSVVREMFERAMTFTEYVAAYQLARSEGAVLRYVADVYKALQQTVPEPMRTAELTDIIEWLGELVRQTDSSLLAEWEQLAAGEGEAAEMPLPRKVSDEPPPITANRTAFRVLVRNAMFRRVELAARERWDELGELDADSGWDAARWESALDAYFEDHDDIGTGPDARGPSLFQVEEGIGGHAGFAADLLAKLDADVAADLTGHRLWLVRQILDDPDGDHGWAITALVDLDASDHAAATVLHLVSVAELGESNAA